MCYIYTCILAALTGLFRKYLKRKTKLFLRYNIFSRQKDMADRFQPDCDPPGRFSLYVVLQRSDETKNFNRVEKRAAPEDMGAISVFLS